MKLNLITLMSDLHAKNKEIAKDNENFINDLNNCLIDEDIYLEKNSKDAVIDAVFIASGGAEAKFKRILNKLSEPFILFSSSKNNSLAASLEIKTYAGMNKHSVCFLAGKAEEIAIAMKHVATVVFAYKKVLNTNLGCIGKPSDWLIASKVSKKQVYDAFQINLIDIKMEELYELIDQHDIDTSHPRYDELVKKYKNKEVLEDALAIYTAIKKLVKKYDLKGVTIRCFDLLDRYKNTACLALAMLNEEGIVSACEGDVPSLITMYLLYVLTDRPSFQANISEFNLQSLTGVLAHCTVPFNMIDRYELPTHFESNLGIGIKGNMLEGNISIVKVAPSLDGKGDLIASGVIKENLSLPGFCRTQILVQFEENDIVALLKENYGNHVIVTYSDVIPDFYPLLNLFKHKEIM